MCGYDVNEIINKYHVGDKLWRIDAKIDRELCFDCGGENVIFKGYPFNLILPTCIKCRGFGYKTLHTTVPHQITISEIIIFSYEKDVYHVNVCDENSVVYELKRLYDTEEECQKGINNSNFKNGYVYEDYWMQF